MCCAHQATPTRLLFSSLLWLAVRHGDLTIGWRPTLNHVRTSGARGAWAPRFFLNFCLLKIIFMRWSCLNFIFSSDHFGHVAHICTILNCEVFFNFNLLQNHIFEIIWHKFYFECWPIWSRQTYWRDIEMGTSWRDSLINTVAHEHKVVDWCGVTWTYSRQSRWHDQSRQSRRHDEMGQWEIATLAASYVKAVDATSRAKAVGVAPQDSRKTSLLPPQTLVISLAWGL